MVATMVAREYVHVYCTNIKKKWYVHVYVLEYHGTRVRTYVLIMLCHNYVRTYQWYVPWYQKGTNRTMVLHVYVPGTYVRIHTMVALAGIAMATS